MKLLATLTMVILIKISFGQVLFNNNYSKPNFDYADAVIERHDGKYLIAGSSRSQFVTDYDVNILLVDSVGNLIWNKYIGKSPRLEFACSLIETKDSNYLISGSVDNGKPYLMKFNSSGSLLWDKEYPSSFGTRGFSVGETSDSHYFFVSQDTSTTLFVTNSVGDTLWTRRYNFANCQSVIQTSDSGFALTGNTNPSTTNQNIILIKTNSVGDTLWTKTFGGVGKDDAASVKQLSDNGFLIAGNFDPQIIDGDKETFIIRTNSIGDTIWTKKYYLGIAHSIKECRNNNGYILSSKNYWMNSFPKADDYYLVITKLDELGNVQWSRQFEGETESLGNNVTQTSEGDFLLTGFIDNGTAMADVLLIKLDSIGNYVLSVNGILDQNSLRVFAFPNPVINEICFILNSDNGRKINQVSIFNSLGQELKSIVNLDENKIETNVRNFETGIYFYKLTTSDKQIATGKFIVRK